MLRRTSERARSRRSASASTSRPTRPATPVSLPQTYGTEHHEVVLHEPALAHLARRHPAHRGAEGQLAAAVPAAPVHRRARVGGAVRARRRRAVRRLRLLQLPAARTPAAGRRGSAPGVRALAPALDWAARRAAGLGRPRARPGHPQARVARRLRRRRPQLPAAPQRLGLQPRAAAARVHARVRSAGSTAPDWDDYGAYFGDGAAAGEPGVAGRVRDQDGVRPAAQRGHHVDGALGGVPRPAARPRTGPVRRPHPRRHPVRRRPQGAAEGGADRGAARPGAAQAEVGIHLRPCRAVPEGPRADGPGDADTGPAAAVRVSSTPSSSRLCSRRSRTSASAGTTSCSGR